LYLKDIDVSANQLLVKTDESFEAIIDLEQYKQYFEKFTSSILHSSQNSCTCGMKVAQNSFQLYLKKKGKT